MFQLGAQTVLHFLVLRTFHTGFFLARLLREVQSDAVTFLGLRGDSGMRRRSLICCAFIWVAGVSADSGPAAADSLLSVTYDITGGLAVGSLTERATSGVTPQIIDSTIGVTPTLHFPSRSQPDQIGI
jgi:hypothetical protein